MDQATHNKIVSFIWGIADDVLRDLFKRGKYADVILPMCVLRRMDAVLEPTKQAVLEARELLDKAGITEQRAALCSASGEAFYNTSTFTLRDLRARASQQNSWLTSTTISTAFHLMSRTSSRTSNFVTNYRRSQKPTPSAR